MINTHVALFGVLLAIASAMVVLSVLDMIRTPEAGGHGVIVAMTATGKAFCCGAGLYGAFYNASYVQEIAVMTGAVILFVGFLPRRYPSNRRLSASHQQEDFACFCKFAQRCDRKTGAGWLVTFHPLDLIRRSIRDPENRPDSGVEGLHLNQVGQVCHHLSHLYFLASLASRTQCADAPGFTDSP